MSTGSPRLQEAAAARFFVAVMSLEKSPHTEAERLLAERWGPLDGRSDCYCFSEYSRYYEAELGGVVWKYFVAMDQLQPVGRLVDLKLWTEEIEQRLAAGNGLSRQRTVNLDPGIVTGWQVVLATVKNHAHRIYLRDGVYAELGLIYRHRVFEPLPWTYPDYRQPLVIRFLQSIRPGRAGSTTKDTENTKIG